MIVSIIGFLVRDSYLTERWAREAALQRRPALVCATWAHLGLLQASLGNRFVVPANEGRRIFGDWVSLTFTSGRYYLTPTHEGSLVGLLFR